MYRGVRAQLVGTVAGVVADVVFVAARAPQHLQCHLLHEVIVEGDVVPWHRQVEFLPPHVGSGH